MRLFSFKMQNQSGVQLVIPITIKDFPTWPNLYSTMFLPYFDTQ
jgi:hypothetical protein